MRKQIAAVQGSIIGAPHDLIDAHVENPLAISADSVRNGTSQRSSVRRPASPL
jgi:hypothetical protein